MPSASRLAVSRQAIRRFLLDAQDLLGDHHYRPGAVATSGQVLREIRRLEAVQLDPVAAVERNQHLVLAARVPGYIPARLQQLLAHRQIFEYWGHASCVFPIEDYPLFEHKRRQIRRRLRADLEKVRSVARVVLARLEREGPLPARAFITEQRVHGWWDIKGPKTKVTSHALNMLSYVGQVMVVRREGLERYFDLPERVVPAELLRRSQEIDTREADQALLIKYMRAHRIFDLRDWAFGWRRVPGLDRLAIVKRLIRAGTVIPLQIDGVRRSYYMLAEDEARLRRHERRASQMRQITDAPVRFLAPLDNLLWRRERIRDFFDFHYTWEVYVPPAKRAYGYYTMPILAGDRFIGRFDPRLDREHGRLVINLLHLERGVRATATMRTALEDALQAFARFHGASDLSIVRSRPARLLSNLRSAGPAAII